MQQVNFSMEILTLSLTWLSLETFETISMLRYLLEFKYSLLIRNNISKNVYIGNDTLSTITAIVVMHAAENLVNRQVSSNVTSHKLLIIFTVNRTKLYICKTKGMKESISN